MLTDHRPIVAGEKFENAIRKECSRSPRPLQRWNTLTPYFRPVNFATALPRRASSSRFPASVPVALASGSPALALSDRVTGSAPSRRALILPNEGRLSATVETISDHIQHTKEMGSLSAPWTSIWKGLSRIFGSVH